MTEDKSEKIIKVAQERFGLYGFDKTSMREIAEDMHMSKGALYYYFPGKESLYRSVIDKELSEFLRNMDEDLSNIPDPMDCLRKYVVVRLSYFKTLLNLSRLRAESLSELRPFIVDTLDEFREKEKKHIMKLLEKGRANKQIRITNFNETASLFLDLLRGLRSSVLKNKKLLVLDDEEYQVLSKKTIAFTEIFIRGLL
jgi:AcrR family transcriptional regulator